MRSVLGLVQSDDLTQGKLTSRTRLRVRPLWYNGLRCGQVFHDPHDHVLEYHVVPHDRYSSYVDCESLRIDVDAAGCPVLLEVDLTAPGFKIVDTLVPPFAQCLQRHRFLDFPIRHRSPRVSFNPFNNLYHIALSRRIPFECWTFAPGAAWEVDEHSCLVGIWLADSIQDPSGCRRAGWRAGVWRAYRRGRLQEISSDHSRLERGWLSLPKIFP